MKPVLIIYATREGHCRRIGEHLRALFARQQRDCEFIDAVAVPKALVVGDYAAAIAIASLHSGNFEQEMVTFVKSHRNDLERIPSLFLSVSLAERGAEDPTATPESRAKAAQDVKAATDRFLAKTGWSPTRIAAAAGALAYRKYDFVTRFIMKQISKASGGPTDTSRDYEFTDWDKLDQEIEEFEAAEHV